MLEKWHRADELLREFSFIAARRPGRGDDAFRRCAEGLYLRHGTRVILMDNPLMDVSSSEIRARVRAGKSIDGLVPASVGIYIYEKGLYRKP
jgi:nicotinate-nucleotide adenylyltransferase